MFANRLPVKRTNPQTALAISGANKSVFGGVLAEGRTSYTTYIDSADGLLKTAAANVPVWENGGLRHEGAALVTILRSEEIDNALWGKTDSTITPNATLAPDGNLTADFVTEGSAGSAFIINTSSAAYTNGQVISNSVFVKRGNFDWIRVRHSTSSGNGYQVWVNLATGALGTTSAIGVGTLISIVIKAVANGFFKITVNYLANDASTSNYVQMMSSPSSGNPGRTSNGTYYAWGINSPNANSSYIPTTTAAVTRATCALSIPLVLNTNFYQRSAILMRVRAKHANSATAKSWLTASTTAEGLIDNGSGALTFVDSSANTATVDLTSWAADDIILVSLVTDDITGLMSLSASKDNGVTWMTSTDTAFAGLTVGANWLFFSANPEVFETLGFKVKKSNKGFAQMKSWALSHAIGETQ
jgi:hypothetical protein